MSLEAMKQALEALKLCNGAETADGIIIYTYKEITSLRQAIKAAEKQEPYGYFRYDIRLDAWVQNRDSNKGVAFYTHPPKREWINLTYLEIDQIYCDSHDDKGRPLSIKQYERAIEAKLREKNT